jgi:hypothetical protein
VKGQEAEATGPGVGRAVSDSILAPKRAPVLAPQLLLLSPQLRLLSPQLLLLSPPLSAPAFQQELAHPSHDLAHPPLHPNLALGTILAADATATLLTRLAPPNTGILAATTIKRLMLQLLLTCVYSLLIQPPALSASSFLTSHTFSADCLQN